MFVKCGWTLVLLFFFPCWFSIFLLFFSWFDISNVAPLLTFWLVDVSVCRLKELQASDQVWFPVSLLCIMTGKPQSLSWQASPLWLASPCHIHDPWYFHILNARLDAAEEGHSQNPWVNDPRTKIPSETVANGVWYPTESLLAATYQSWREKCSLNHVGWESPCGNLYSKSGYTSLEPEEPCWSYSKYQSCGEMEQGSSRPCSTCWSF